MFQDKRRLYVTGMFRSGTTTLSRALNTHPAIAFAADPFLDLFKILRTDVAADLGQSIPAGAPLANYYFDAGEMLLYDALRVASLDRPFPQGQHAELLEASHQRCTSYSPSLAPYVSDISGTSYWDYVLAMHDRIGAAYGGPATAYTGFKEVWATEFLPHLLAADPDARAVTVVRDPRAVAASQNAKETKYPWDFLARQWRKLAGLGWNYSRHAAFAGRVKLLHYEDLILSPEATMRELCCFLELEWDPNVADPAAYDDGGGGNWVQNSTFGSAGAVFDASATTRWREKLEAAQAGYLDWLCSPDMQLLGYEAMDFSQRRTDAGWTVEPPRIAEAEQAEWMRGVIPADPLTARTNAATESLRKQLLYSDRHAGPDWRPETAFQLGALLELDLLDELCSAARGALE